MLIPIFDHNPVDRKPIVTYVIIGLNFAVWVFVQGGGMLPGLYEQSLCSLALFSGDLLGLIPDWTMVAMNRGTLCSFDGPPNFHTLVTHMFLHGSWLHILSNMLFLWIFGDNIENALGRVRFVIFYLLCGFVAAGAQMLSDLDSIAALLGASGAVSGVLGAYIILHPRSRLKVLLFFFLPIELPAIVFLGFYFVIQLVGVFGPVGTTAYWAHIGGFLAGLALVRLMKKKEQTFTLSR